MTTMQLYLSHNADYYTSVFCEVLLSYGIHLQCGVYYCSLVLTMSNGCHAIKSS